MWIYFSKLKMITNQKNELNTPLFKLDLTGSPVMSNNLGPGAPRRCKLGAVAMSTFSFLCLPKL